MCKRHGLTRWGGFIRAMSCFIAHRSNAVRSACERATLALASPTASPYQTTHVTLNHFVKSIEINPVKVVSIAQTQGFGDTRVLRDQRQPLQDRACRSVDIGPMPYCHWRGAYVKNPGSN